MPKAIDIADINDKVVLGIAINVFRCNSDNNRSLIVEKAQISFKLDQRKAGFIS